jgi:hypothetical protein
MAGGQGMLGHARGGGGSGMAGDAGGQWQEQLSGPPYQPHIAGTAAEFSQLESYMPGVVTCIDNLPSSLSGRVGLG